MTRYRSITYEGVDLLPGLSGRRFAVMVFRTGRPRPWMRPVTFFGASRDKVEAYAAESIEEWKRKDAVDPNWSKPGR